MSFEQQLISWRRELHQNPELSGQEVETTTRLRQWLTNAGITPQPYDLSTGLVAEIGSGNKLIALRADIDALPIEERSGVPFSSQRAGVMHACGHDGHAAMLLALAPLVGYSFVQAVSLFAEASKSAVEFPELARGMTPLDGILLPTLGAFYLAVTLLFPFVAIRAIGQDKQTGAAKLVAQFPVGTVTLLVVKTLAVGERSPAWKVRQALIAAGDASYRFDQFKSSPADERALTHLAFAVAKDGEQKAAETALTQGLAIAEGCALARDLGNLPGNVCTPEYLARTARELADEFGLELEVLEREDIVSLGMGAFAAVAAGSEIGRASCRERVSSPV